MAHRATRLNDDFIKALNMIDLEFAPRGRPSKDDRAVIDAWRSLHGEYTRAPADGAEQHEVTAWSQRIEDRIAALLLAMSKALKYNFTEEQIRRGIYYPRGRVEIEQNAAAILPS